MIIVIVILTIRLQYMKFYPFKKSLILLSVTAMTLTACTNNVDNQSQPINQTVSKSDDLLKNIFKDRFKIGTALSRKQIIGNETNILPFVNQHFNALTPENSMKWEKINPQPNIYDFEASDALVEFSNKHNHSFTGHTLVWHSQVPNWVFEHSDGTPLNRKELLKRMEAHINKVAGRYAGKIQAWDVVNEALNEDGTLRKSKWYSIIGEDFIEYAFKFAAKAAPQAKLYYNDYNLYKPEKRQGVINLVKNLQSKGIKIDGVGMQAHYSLDTPNFNEVEDSISAYAALDVDVLITELDISVIPFPNKEKMGADVSLNFELQDEFNPYPLAIPKAIEQKQAKRYQELFHIFNKHQKSIERITFWGVDDSQSWKNDWPMPGRSDYPLLIDRQLTLKPFAKTLNQQ